MAFVDGLALKIKVARERIITGQFGGWWPLPGMVLGILLYFFGTGLFSFAYSVFSRRRPPAHLPTPDLKTFQTAEIPPLSNPWEMMPEEVVVADAPASPSYFYDHWGVAREMEPPTVHNPWETPLKPTVKTVPLYSASWDRTRGQQEVHVHTPPDASKPEVLKPDHPKEPQTDHPNDARLSERVAQTLEDAKRTLAEAKNMLAQDVQTLVQQYRLSLDDGEQTLEGVQHLLAKEEKD
eukprot:CAMPEP_0198225440 /NCGR_PEP_ID=MMETSP1445-20131203/101107_1 /TAXON_ID=36898 /ORGANISM="Pyramimonas sp., Strain CCMP2087" /LENGTH=236 /DNA_ID=CAMNT_0043904961 /DNA_START=38 /DNA_END=745 /DNA_ORIENTATION=-